MEPVVHTSRGPVRGDAGDRVFVFRGIPYAADPSGAGRFRPPQPPVSWTDTRDATTFGPAAPQPTQGALDGLVPGLAVDHVDEDCLSVNVWTPSLSGRRPVLVWLHGGAFTIGASSSPTYDGASLARRGDVVVVSCNYRLGVLGFGALDDDHGTNANCGLLDQVAALQWVCENAEAFGGDPSRVTVFGESAGGGSVLSLLAMPAARGLFQRAIVQSGMTTTVHTLDAARDATARVAHHAGIDGSDLLAWQRVPVGSLLDAQRAAAADLLGTVGLMPFHPTVDPATMPTSWLEAARQGHSHEVALVIGTTHDELDLFASMDPGLATLDDDGLVRRLAALGDPARIVSAYRDVYPEATARRIWQMVQTDTAMWMPAIHYAEAHRAVQPATFMYRFDWPAADEALGACHGIDIPFPFDSIEVPGWADFLDGPDRAHLLAKSVQHAWAAFAHGADPTSPGLPHWVRYDTASRPTMVLGPESALVHDPRAPIRALWDGLAHAPGRADR
jgi:para-nitrobenzyl esterase